MEQDGVSDFMMPKKLIIGVVLLLLALYATLSFARSITRALSPIFPGSVDFHAYWYSGHFVIQGSDPYESYFQGRKPNLPIHYIDGYSTSSYPVGQPDLSKVPANTAPIVLFISLFSLFSWPTAKVLWLIFNIGLAFSITLIATRLYPRSPTASIDWKPFIILLIFWSWLATRECIILGQTTSLIVLLMLLSIATIDKSWIFSGISLGLALSKYSLSLPVFLFFLLEKKYKVLVLSFLTQLTGLFTLAFVTNTSPLQVLDGYIRILLLHANDSGIHIAWALQVSDSELLSFLIAIIFTLVTAAPVLFWMHYYYPHLSKHDQRIGEFHILVTLIIWSLLIAYHREYDAIVMVLFIVLVIYGMSSNIWNLPDKARIAISFLVAFAIAYLMRPETIIIELLFSSDASLDDTIRRPFRLVTTLLLIFCLFLTVALLYRIHPSTNMRLSTQSDAVIQSEHTV